MLLQRRERIGRRFVHQRRAAFTPARRVAFLRLVESDGVRAALGKNADKVRVEPFPEPRVVDAADRPGRAHDRSPVFRAADRIGVHHGEHAAGPGASSEQASDAPGRGHDLQTRLMRQVHLEFQGVARSALKECRHNPVAPAVDHVGEIVANLRRLPHAGNVEVDEAYLRGLHQISPFPPRRRRSRSLVGITRPPAGRVRRRVARPWRGRRRSRSGARGWNRRCSCRRWSAAGRGRTAQNRRRVLTLCPKFDSQLVDGQTARLTDWFIIVHLSILRLALNIRRRPD